MLRKRINVNRQLFAGTSHTPALVDLVGEQNMNKVTDFCFIENPYFPDNKTLEKLNKEFLRLIKFYPSSNPILAQQNLADVIKVSPEHLVIGNGATELITIIQNQLADDMGIPIPTFSEYIEKLKDSEKVKLFNLSEHKKYQLNLDEYGEWLIREKISSALIINPGNPSGQLFSIEEMKSFLGKMKHLKLILVDESFIDFSCEEIPTLLPSVNEFPNLIIVRSMSKHCGVPGLRLGYCCTSNQHFLSVIRNVLPVWNINTVAEYFLTLLKETEEIYEIARKKVIEDVRLLYNELILIPGFSVYQTGSNFLLIKILDLGFTAFEMQMKLLEEHGVYVRDCTNKVGLDNMHIRLASQGRQRDKKLVKALRCVSKQVLPK